MNLHDALLAILIAVNLLGGFLLKRWIDSLRGTVEAQKTALDSVHRVLDTVMNVFKATDPDRWAKEVAIHKELADRKAAALVEEERRLGEERLKTLDENATAFLVGTQLGMESSRTELLGAAARLLAEIPRTSREPLIREMGLSNDTEGTLLKAAEEAPDSVSVVGGDTLDQAVAVIEEQLRRREEQRRRRR